MHVKSLIIGSGFAGRTVASYLGEDYLIIERGEKVDYAAVLARASTSTTQEAYKSKLPWNQFRRLSRLCNSYYPMLVGGASNAWGGNSRRLPPRTFARDDAPLKWPLSYAEMIPWYERAERRLNLTGDPAYSGSLISNTTEGFLQWRYALRPYLNGSGLSGIAINTGQAGRHGQGVCKGRSRCETCYEDAKARPDNLFGEMQLLPETQCITLNFDDRRATSATCYNGKELFDISFDRCVVAANGIESPALLLRSQLPPDVPRKNIGRYLQDHTHFELQCLGDFELPYNTLGSFGHVYVDELAGEYYGIEVSCFALTHSSQLRGHSDSSPLAAGFINCDATHPSLKLVTFFFELEIPPMADIRIELRDDGSPMLVDEAFLQLVPTYDQVIRDIMRKVESKGLKIVSKHPHYQGGYGGHHLAGTLNMGQGEHAVCDTSGRLIGTENVFIAGTGLIPRAGGEGPTLTAVALAERLGEYLMKGQNE